MLYYPKYFLNFSLNIFLNKYFTVIFLSISLNLMVSPVKSEEQQLIKTLSKNNLADKKLYLILSQWQAHSDQQNKNQLITLLNEYHERIDLWLLSLSFLKNKKNNLYKKILYLSMKKFPKNINIALLAAQYHLIHQQLVKANRSLTHVIKTSKDYRVYFLAALISQKQFKHQQAIAIYKKLLAEQPQRGEFHIAIAISLESIGENQSASKHFIAALRDRDLTAIQRNFITQRLIARQG